ncbi:hypothetical protein CKALI_01115 [Corynebacterium kalinowskii]|uniref:Uncharacterized protein n=1 Tax=Corynebacterium kalinowskii TaxID=2675216 RepID=A0A6B8V9T6_9CORY|nr:hypothetical protein CKALI_01115 [Corynebacterium kalinowskii]
MLSTVVDLAGDVFGLAFVVMNQIQTFIAQMLSR